ncbi:hypothetical protein AGLY_006522, partial [Aphis glycines]
GWRFSSMFIHVCQLFAESERVVGHCGYMRILFAIARVPSQSGSGHVRSAGRLDFFDALKTRFAQQFIEVGNDLVQQPWKNYLRLRVCPKSKNVRQHELEEYLLKVYGYKLLNVPCLLFPLKNNKKLGFLPVACNFHKKSNREVTSVCCACRINATISPNITTNMSMRIQNDSSIGLYDC